MKRVWLYFKNILETIQRFFEKSATTDAHKSSHHGIAQFALLLSLCPFIFSLTLFDFHSYTEVASKYQFPPDRFEGLSYEALTAKALGRPSKPKVRISAKNRKLIIKLAKKTPERICNLTPRKLNPFELASKPEFAIRIKLNSQCTRYKVEYRAYRANLAAYDSVNEANKKEDRRLTKQADSFIINSHLKPPVPDIEIIERSNQQFQQLLKQIALDDTLLLVDKGEVLSNTDQINDELSDDSQFLETTVWQSLRSKLLDMNSF